MLLSISFSKILFDKWVESSVGTFNCCQMSDLTRVFFSIFCILREVSISSCLYSVAKREMFAYLEAVSYTMVLRLFPSPERLLMKDANDRFKGSG